MAAALHQGASNFFGVNDLIMRAVAKTSKYRGVSKDGHKWRVLVGRSYVGSYESQEEAARVYDLVASCLYPGKRKLNFPSMPQIPEGARAIQLTQGQWAIVDAADYDELAQYEWCLASGYAWRRVPGTQQSVFMHQTLLSGREGFEVDHENRNRLDNRRCNLRLAPRRDNAANRSKSVCGSSRFKGVYWHTAAAKWAAEITKDYKKVYLGLHMHEEEAARAYDRAARRYFGAFAYLNFPDEVDSE